MFWVSSIRSAGGAANYFAKDNYYTQEESSEWSAWGGKGADFLNLSGQVDKDTFEALLNSELPDGTIVNEHENKRFGYDLTFSMPKSASILAYVGGDERILASHRAAVATAMRWVEENAAEVRSYTRDPKNGDAVRTGNLVYAMFQHDTSRALDPQGHIHVVVAAVSRTADGVWKALWNGELFDKNSTIGSIYHAAFRENLVNDGYQVRMTGKHGQFEIDGVPKAVLDPFSQRRTEVLDKAAELGISTPQGQDQVVKRTRDRKVTVDDHDGLRAEWKAKAEALGYDASKTVNVAIEASQNRPLVEHPIGDKAAGSFVERVIATARLYLRTNDSLTTNGIGRALLTPSEIRTEMALASAIRIIGETEAAFDNAKVLKTALDLNLRGVTDESVEKRMSALVTTGKLIRARSDRVDGVSTKVTTPEHVAIEREVLLKISQGKENGVSLLPQGSAEKALHEVDPARLVNPVTLDYDQTMAASKALASTSRTFVIQGVAGAGKSVMIDAIARVAEDHGREVIGLSTAETTVNALRKDANVTGQNISSFVAQHILGARKGEGPLFEKSKSELAGKILVLDEASLSGNLPTLNLLRIADAFDVEKFIMVGDRNQLLSVEHGNTYAMIQASKPEMALLTQSQRQKTDDMKALAETTRNRDIAGAFKVLGERVIEAGKEFRSVAAERWLALSPEMREKTDVYTSGRVSRAELNEAIQEGLRAEGTIKGPSVVLSTLNNVNLTREELRYAHNYENGMTMQVFSKGMAGSLEKGSYTVTSVDNTGRVWLKDEDGKKRSFRPDSIDPNERKDPLRLMERDRVELQEGDRIRWNDRDKDRDIFKSEKATVLSVSEDGITIENARGRIETLKPGDPLLKSVSLSYAINMHQAQGMTQDHAIGVMSSNERNLSTARLFHVMVTRVKYDMEIVTNDSRFLQKTIEHQTGDKSSALHAIGVINIPDPRQVSQSALYNVNQSIGKPISHAEMRVSPEDHKGPQENVPEKVKERGL